MIAYDDERVIHAESGDWVAFPCEYATRDEARMQVAEMVGCGTKFVEIRCRKRTLKEETDPALVPPVYDSWWTYCEEDDPAAVWFWVCE